MLSKSLKIISKLTTSSDSIHDLADPDLLLEFAYMHAHVATTYLRQYDSSNNNYNNNNNSTIDDLLIHYTHALDFA